jgi:hypothetical protein
VYETSFFMLMMASGITLVFWIAGYKGAWRRSLATLGLTYSAVILTSQHNIALAELDLMQSLARTESALKLSAFAFAVGLAVFLVGLAIAFRLTWGPVSSRKASADDGAVKLLRSLLTGLSGWVISAVLVVSVLSYQTGRSAVSGAVGRETFVTSAALTTTRITMALVDPWLPSGPPAFLTGR